MGRAAQVITATYKCVWMVCGLTTSIQIFDTNQHVQLAVGLVIEVRTRPSL